MAYLTSPGATAITLGAAGTKRDDIDETLLASLAISNNLAGAVTVGAPFDDSILKFVEDSLNPQTVTDTTATGINNAVTSTTVSTGDAALLRVGWIISDIASSASGLGGGEQMRISSVNPNTGVIGLDRAANGTTATSHAQSAVYQVVVGPELEVSGLNADMSRTRLSKYNYITRHARDVIVSNEQNTRASGGYAPGVPEEMKYQLKQRMAEMTQMMSTALLYSRPYSGRNGSNGVSGGDYSTFAGLYAWLDGTFNTTAAAISWATQGWGTGQVEAAMNFANRTVDKNGGLLDWVVVGSAGAQDIGRIGQDRIRLVQNEMTRGFAVNVFRTLLGNELTVLRDAHVEDATGIGEIFLLDSGRFRIRPRFGQFCNLITAPTFLDAGIARVVCKYSNELRNTGTDAGAAHAMITGCNFNQS